MTLRPERDAGAHYMPAERAKRLRRGGRNVSVGVPHVAADAVAQGLTVRSLLGPHDDGLVALHVSFGGAGVYKVPLPERTRAAYILILDGAVTVADAVLGAGSLAFVKHEREWTAVAAEAGCVQLLLGFPEAKLEHAVEG
jgi:redox-sensitive bicupin YhaK (pirin superfamily)